MGDLAVIYRLWSRSAENVLRIASSTVAPVSAEDQAKDETVNDPFAMSAKSVPKGADAPAKDDTVKPSALVTSLSTKHLFITQWRIVEGLLHSCLDLADAQAVLGSPRECEFYLKQTSLIAKAVRSSGFQARAATKMAELQARRRKFEESKAQLEEAEALLHPVSCGLSCRVNANALKSHRCPDQTGSR